MSHKSNLDQYIEDRRRLGLKPLSEERLKAMQSMADALDESLPGFEDMFP